MMLLERVSCSPPDNPGGNFLTIPTWSSTSHTVLSNPRSSGIQIQAYRVSFPGMAGDDQVELAIVTMRFDAADADSLMAVLSKYVVLTRMQPGCRNIDLCA